MGSATKVLRESFSLLTRKPRLFAPKIFSTLTASLLLVFLLERLKTGVSMELTLAMFPVLFIVSILGVYSSMMLSEMVKSGGSLRKSFRKVGSRQLNVLSTAFFFLLAGFMLSIVPVAGYIAYLNSGSMIFLLAATVLFFASLFALSYASYFLPITLLEKKGLKEAFSDSMQTSGENRKVVTALLLFSLALFGLAALSTGFLETLGYAGFVAGRLVSSTVNTYVFTVSPAYYLESRAENVV